MKEFGIKKIAFTLKCHINYLINKLIYMLFPMRRNKFLTIIPHEGLGDLIAILPALQALHKNGVHITLATDVAKWSQITNTFMDVPHIDIIQTGSITNYSVPYHLFVNNESSLIPLGYFSSFGFIIDYPYSFFWQLGIDRSVMADPLFHKPCCDDFQLPEFYDFIDLGTSRGVIECDNYSSSLAENKITFLNNTEMIVTRSGSELHMTLNSSKSFHQKICIALRSQVIICSDAALFNAIIRMRVHPKIIVHTRKHYHSHCKEIYGSCKFDGGIHEFPARNG